jgi:hypothetical protein
MLTPSSRTKTAINSQPWIVMRHNFGHGDALCENDGLCA